MVSKLTLPATENEVQSKVNELVDDKQDTLVSGTNIKTINGTSLLGSGNLAFDSSLSTSSTNAAQNKVITSALKGKLDGFNISVAGNWTGGAHAVNFITFDYTNCNSENDIFIKLSMVNSHGNGITGRFFQDVILNCNYTGTVAGTIYRYFAENVDASMSYNDHKFGDIFWTIDTTNKIVKFYVLMRQYSYTYMTPYFRLNASTKGVISQKSGVGQEEYSSGTQYWASISWYETDQTYSATSPKPQSGVAVAGALNSYVPTSRTVNGKALSNNISLTASDVGALPSSTVIPTVNNATLTIQNNGSNVATFTANASSNVTANISVPTKTSDLTNDSGYTTNSDIAGMYHYAGSVAFANLPTPASSNVGSVYNVTDDFTTTSSFLEGSGKSYLAGTDVVIVRDGSGSTLYAWEVTQGDTPNMPSGTVIYTDTENPTSSFRIYDVNGNDITDTYVFNTSGVFPKGGFSEGFLPLLRYIYSIDVDENYIAYLSRNSSLDVTGGFYFDVFSGSGYQTTANLVTSVSSSSTNSQYPSAKLFYDTVGDVETLLHNLNSGS